MKPLVPVKTVALAALAATMILPAANALPTTKVQASHPASSVPAATASAPLAPASEPLSAGATPISLAIDQGDLRNVLATIFKKENLDYTIDPGVSGTVSVHMNGIPFQQALITLLESGSQPLGYTVQNNVYRIYVRAFSAPTPLVSVDLKKVPIRQALDSLFTAAKANYTVASGVPGDSDIVTIHLTDVPLDQALDAVLAASEIPLMYNIKAGGIFVITPKPRSGIAF